MHTAAVHLTWVEAIGIITADHVPWETSTRYLNRNAGLSLWRNSWDFM